MSHQSTIITLEEGWKTIYNDGILKLQDVIKSELKTSFKHQEYMDLYTIIYKMCIQKSPHSYTSHLYDRFQSSISSYLQDVSLPAILSQSGEFMVQELVKRWEDHKIMKKWMCDIFRYLDRFFVKRHGKEPLQDVAINKFCTVVFDQVKKKITIALLDLIKRDRDGEGVDRDLLRQAINIYVEMGMGSNKTYQEEFEAPFLQATTDYYSGEAASWLASDSCPEYLRKTQQRFGQEKKRISDYLHSDSDEKLMECLYQTLLLQHQTEILGKENTGCKCMLETHSTDDLARMYILYNNVQTSLEPIAKIVNKHITEVGTALITKVNDQKSAATYIEDLIKIHEKYYELVLTCFKGNAIFHKALKQAFETIVNERTFQSSTAELLSDYADQLLRKGGIKLTEKQLEATLDNLVRLFTYLIDKDMFSEFYRKALSKRLLLQRSASTDAEKSMIGKLKLRCGAQFTSKLEGMINDMRSAQDQHISFKDFIRDREIKLGFDFTVQTLTTGFWPSYKAVDLHLPIPLMRALETFKLYYNTKTNNRKLRWIHQLGVVTVTGDFKKGRRELEVSTIQAAILILFNEYEELSIESLIKHTGLDPENMKTQLRSLVSGKFKILLKKPAEGYNISHKMKVNQAFTHAQKRIRIPNAVNKTTKGERDKAQIAVEEDRKHAIEANIVRIMKSRKTLTHQKLMIEVSAQLMQYFKPDPRQIKKRIEDLIAREYLERDSEKSNVYHYLA